MRFRIASACFPFVFRRIKSTSSLYSPLSSLFIVLSNFERINSPTSSQTEKIIKSRFYNIQLIAKEPQVVDDVLKNSVHYVGYRHDFDEWVPVNRIINTLPLTVPEVMPDVFINDLSILRIRINESLNLKGRMDTNIVLNQPIALQMCGVLSPRLKIIKVCPRRATIYTTEQESLSDLFRDSFWFRHIVNGAGDMAQISMSTLQVLCTCKKSMKEYVEKNGKLVLNEIESILNLKLQFVIKHYKY